MSKTIFWNVDTQVDFMRSSGRLYVPGAETLEENLAKLTRLAEKQNIQVINTEDWHTEKTNEISKNPDYINTFGEHCMAGTSGAEYIPTTKPDKPYIVDYDKGFDRKDIIDSRNIIIRKDAFDVFKGNPNTKSIVDIINPNRVFVYGVATNFCVDYAVMGLAKKAEVYVVKDAIKEIPLPGEPEKTFKKWEDEKVKFITTNEMLKLYES
jgi:nicotinamidase/pyrazinamidase